MKLSTMTILLCSALAMVGCKKKGNPAESGSGGGSGSATVSGSGSAATSGSGSATMGGSSGSGSATAGGTPAGKDELTSAVWRGGGKIDAPLAFDRQLWSDNGNGSLQMFLIAKCANGPDVCALLKFDNLQHEELDKVCPGWSMVHIVFNPQKDQKANMGPLTLTPGKYGGDSEPVKLGMIEYTDKNDGNPGTVGGQIYQKEPNVELTQVSDTLAGTFDSKDGEYAYKGSFTAKKCTCDQNEPTCK